MQSPLQLLIYRQTELFTTEVRPFLEANEAENSLLLGILGELEQRPSSLTPWMAAGKEGKDTRFAALLNEVNLIITRGPQVLLDAAIQKLKEASINIPGVIGPSADAEYVAKHWSQIGNCTYAQTVNQRLYQLTQVRWPTGISGNHRLARVADLDLLSRWKYEFDREAVSEETADMAKARANVEPRIQNRLLYVWEANHQTVAMASLARPSSRGISVNAVYTPPHFRKRGYASALVAAVSQEGLKQGKDFVVLYTDLSNPTSNSIYQKIGYQPVCDSRHYRFRG